MSSSINRRDFIKLTTMGSMGMGLANGVFSRSWDSIESTKVGIIGLDTSHCIAFTKTLNDPEAPPEFAGYPVVAAYPKGSTTIESSYSRIPKYTKRMKKMGVDIVGSIDELLDKVDVVLLETNDGKPHLEQALKVIKAGKPVFVDKPVAASLSDTIAIYDAAEQYNVPIFSSSGNRYMKDAQAARHGEVGKVLGAETYNPASVEPTHPDLYWYGIHGVEELFTVMGTGCKQVRRIHTEDTDVVVGNWKDDRLGTYRGLRAGKQDFGGTVFGKEKIMTLGSDFSYRPLLAKVIEFFRTGEAPVSREETMEIYAFMSAADVSKRRGGESVDLKEVLDQAKQAYNKELSKHEIL